MVTPEAGATKVILGERFIMSVIQPTTEILESSLVLGDSAFPKDVEPARIDEVETIDTKDLPERKTRREKRLERREERQQERLARQMASENRFVGQNADTFIGPQEQKNVGFSQKQKISTDDGHWVVPSLFRSRPRYSLNPSLDKFPSPYRLTANPTLLTQPIVPFGGFRVRSPQELAFEAMYGDSSQRLSFFEQDVSNLSLGEYYANSRGARFYLGDDTHFFFRMTPSQEEKPETSTMTDEDLLTDLNPKMDTEAQQEEKRAPTAYADNAYDSDYDHSRSLSVKNSEPEQTVLSPRQTKSVAPQNQSAVFDKTSLTEERVASSPICDTSSGVVESSVSEPTHVQTNYPSQNVKPMEADGPMKEMRKNDARLAEKTTGVLGLRYFVESGAGTYVGFAGGYDSTAWKVPFQAQGMREFVATAFGTESHLPSTLQSGVLVSNQDVTAATGLDNPVNQATVFQFTKDLTNHDHRTARRMDDASHHFSAATLNSATWNHSPTTWVGLQPDRAVFIHSGMTLAAASHGLSDHKDQSLFMEAAARELHTVSQNHARDFSDGNPNNHASDVYLAYLDQIDSEISFDSLDTNEDSSPIPSHVFVDTVVV